jgi:transposase
MGRLASLGCPSSHHSKVHERTVQEWVGWYRQGGLAAVRAPRRAGKGRAAKRSPEQQSQLVAQAATGSLFTAGEVRTWVADTFGVVDTASSMSTLLNRLGCAKKVPRPMNPKTSVEAQAAWKRGLVAARTNAGVRAGSPLAWEMRCGWAGVASSVGCGHHAASRSSRRWRSPTPGAL